MARFKDHIIMTAVLVAGLVGYLLSGTASAQGQIDNSGNPAILAAVKDLANSVTSLQTTLNSLQVKVDALASATDGSPSWDSTLPAATRFVVLANFANAAVLDRETGLVWERTPNAAPPANWGEAVLHCAFSTLGGRQGWRLPTAPELLSLRDPAAAGQLLPAGHPFIAVPSGNVFPGNYFWTSTHTNEPLGPFSGNTYMVVSFDPGAPEFVRARLAATATQTWGWCVRGPSNHSID
jgi:uncharacterized protein DUF1566